MFSPMAQSTNRLLLSRNFLKTLFFFSQFLSLLQYLLIYEICGTDWWPFLHIFSGLPHFSTPLMSRQPNVLRLALTNDLEHQKVQHEQFQPTTLVYSPSKAPVKTTLSTRIRHMFVKFFTEWWMLEILSWMFSAICMIAIIVMLSISNGQRMSKFLPYGISLNSYVSILAGFARSALLLSTAAALGQLKWNWFQKEARNMLDFERMDMASRGPWGSMVLLSRSRGL